jgi:hypothetical protein
MLELPLRRLTLNFIVDGHGLPSGLSNRKSSSRVWSRSRAGCSPFLLYKSAVPSAITFKSHLDYLFKKSSHTMVRWLYTADLLLVLLPGLPSGGMIGQSSHSCSNITSLTTQFILYSCCFMATLDLLRVFCHVTMSVRHLAQVSFDYPDNY